MRALLIGILVGGCCPVVDSEPYPLLSAGVPGALSCSWAYVAEGVAVTALHCFSDPGHPALLDVSGAAALVAVAEGEAFDGVPRMGAAGAGVGLFDIVCYADWTGDPNCGRVLVAGVYNLILTAETRLGKHGDSGAAVRDRHGGLVGVVDEIAPGLVMAARVPPEWAQ